VIALRMFYTSSVCIWILFLSCSRIIAPLYVDKWKCCSSMIHSAAPYQNVRPVSSIVSHPNKLCSCDWYLWTHIRTENGFFKFSERFNDNTTSIRFCVLSRKFRSEDRKV